MMNKKQFADALAHELYGLNRDDIAASLEYYNEMIDERVESGMSEADAVAALGKPADIAKEIKLGMPIGKLVKNKCRRKAAWRVREIVLLTLGAPIWLTLLAAVLCVVITLYAAVWSVALAFWVIAVSVLGMAVGFVLIFFFTVGSNPWSAVLYLGTGMVALAFVAPTLYVNRLVTKLTIRASIAILRGIKFLII